MESDFDSRDDAISASDVLFALDWYFSEFERYASNDEDASLERAKRYLADCLYSESCPLDAHDQGRNIFRIGLQNLEESLLGDEKARLHEEEEKRRRKFAAYCKAFVVLLLVVTTAVLWRSSATALSAVAPIILIVYVLLGDSLPLRLATSFFKKEDGER